MKEKLKKASKKDYRKMLKKQIAAHSETIKERDELKALLRSAHSDIHTLLGGGEDFIIVAGVKARWKYFFQLREMAFAGSRKESIRQYPLTKEEMISSPDEFIRDEIPPQPKRQNRQKELDDLLLKWNGPDGIYTKMLPLHRPIYNTTTNDLITTIIRVRSIWEHTGFTLYSGGEIYSLLTNDMEIDPIKMTALKKIPEFDLKSLCFPDSFASFIFILDDQMNPATGVIINVLQ